MERLRPLEVARLEEARQARGMAEIGRESAELAGGRLCYGGPGSWANAACGLGLDGPVDAAAVERLVAYYAERGVEPRVEVATVAHPSLLKGLGARGFRTQEFTHVLVRELAGGPLDTATPHGPTPGLTIERVDPTDEAAAALFVEVSTSGFRPADEPITEAAAEFGFNCLRHERTTCFLARVDGEPAGGGSMEVTPDVACLFGASVLPRFRRRGIQAMLIARRLEHAHAANVPLVCIQATPGIPTERNAARLGFALAYAKATLTLSGPGLAPSP